ncbi:hypothetical protein BC835DRAFT_1524144 [Cytidiella melzeri]|nr:hypothetical protein BC835DRAFT_1524144 [Cytidiella melzeri]
MDHHTLVASPFLQDNPEFQPSSSTSTHFDLPLLESPYDPYSFEPGYPQDNAHFPHTPSYNGSPFSQYSDLPTFDNTDAPDALDLFSDENPSGITIREEYDPAEYDLPNSSSLLTFNDSYMSAVDSSNPHVAITPPAYDRSSPTMYDHASPASSNGLDDDHQSRGSSSSSYIHPNSPPLADFAANFESLHFDSSSPNWPNAQLPNSDRSSPPTQKPQSPPQLVIPDISSPATTAHDEPPTINAPDGDGLLSGPQLHIVPATPISGGMTAQHAPFLQQGNTQDLGAPSWNQQQQLASPSSNQPLPQSNQQQGPYFRSNPSSPGMGFVNRSLPSDITPSPELSRQQQSAYLVPQIPLARSRSLSDTSLRPPLWDTPMSNNTVNMHDVLPPPGSSSPSPSPTSLPHHPSSAGPYQTTFGDNFPSPNRLPHHFSFGPPNTSFSPQSQMPNNNDFLSADVGATNLRRAKSDGMRVPGFGHRQVRSEDYRISTSLAATTASSPNLYPPPGPSSQEFIRNIANRQYLHPTQDVPSVAARGHHRRSSSGSRERPMGWSSGPSSARASPYPSPNASPRPGYGPLPGVDVGLGPTARRSMGVDSNMMSGVDQGMDVVLAGSGEVVTVAKQNVTTPSTADASQKRRKQPANFKCPIPGCGSTFTRHFNLKGHLRSHAEEKPYMCKWPGCQKGFARQHDCKRHEQLHLNIRPYPCEGCKKNFARMDALNRHCELSLMLHLLRLALTLGFLQYAPRVALSVGRFRKKCGLATMKQQSPSRRCHHL